MMQLAPYLALLIAGSTVMGLSNNCRPVKQQQVLLISEFSTFLHFNTNMATYHSTGTKTNILFDNFS